MLKKGISVLFSAILLLFIAAPTIITIVDDTVDVSYVFSTSEEKEKGFEIIFSNEKPYESNLISSSTENNLGYFYKNYPKPHLNLISPPPEHRM